MIPKEFDYLTPTNVEEAVGLLKEYGGRAKVLAGGHGLIPRMKRRLEEPEILVDIGYIPELRSVRRENGTLTVGAATTHAELEAANGLLNTVPILPQAATVVADPLVRNRGTFGGSLVDAESAADWPAVALALDATLHAVGPDSAREIPIRDFFLGPMATVLEPEELLTSVEIPLPLVPDGGRVGMRYEKATHPASGYAVVGVAAVVVVDELGICREGRVAVTGACSRATRATTSEDLLVGEKLEAQTIGQVAERAAEGLDLVGDHHASASYRGHLVGVYTERTLRAATAQAGWPSAGQPSRQ